MQKRVLAGTLAFCLFVAVGCNSTIKEWTHQALEEAKRIAQAEGSKAADARVDEALKDLQTKGLDPAQINSLLSAFQAYLDKRDSSKGPVDYDLLVNILIAYLGGSYIKRRLPGLGPIKPPAEEK